MAKQDVTTQLFYDGGWHDADAYTRDPIRVSRGRGDEQSEPAPSSAALTLDNRDGSKNPRNPSSSLYGKIGRNTPLRVLLDTDTRMVGEVASWAPDRTVNFDATTGKGDAWTGVVANGVLRRLGQGADPLRSPLYRATSALSPVAWWPLEEEAAATNQGASGLPSGPEFHLDSGTATYGAHTDTPGALRAPELIAAKMSAPLTTTTAGTGWAVHFAWKATKSGAFPLIAPVQWRTANGDIWACYFSPSGYNIGVVVNNAGFADVPMAGGFMDPFDGEWHSMLMLVTKSGADTVAHSWRDGIDEGTNTGTGYTFSEISGLVSFPDESFATITDVDSVGVSHLAFFETTTAPTELADATAGWAGETAGNRFLRLCAEQDVTATVDGDQDDTTPMGVQSSDTLVNLLTEVERTDGGLLFEPRDSLGLTYRTLDELTNQAPALALDWDAGDVAPPLTPVLDDQATRNDVTVSRRGGSTARVAQETGPLNVQAPTDDPDGVGRYTTKVEVNPEDDSYLAGLAAWYLHRGTVAEIRYPRVTVDLDASPELATDATAVDIGDRITIDNLPADIDPNQASLIVLGYTESIGSHRRTITFNCAPFAPYNVFELDGDFSRLADDGDSTVASVGGISSTATSISVATASGALWSTDAADYPSTIDIEGEHITVTAVAGTSSPQTFTVTRSANGVVKSHPAGAGVTVVDAFTPAL